MYWRRKGQAGAAVLIALMALLILLYILFLPPEDRAALLGEGDTTPGTGPAPPESNFIFRGVPTIQENAGLESQFLPTFGVRTRTQGEVLASRSSVHVERTVFHNAQDTIKFSTPQNSKNLFLSFTVSQATGRLMIYLNDELVFSQELQGRQGPQISIPADRLSLVNELRFSASGVGFQIWNKNQYTIDNVLLTADVTTFDEASQTQRFVLTDVDEIKRIQLRFRPDCYEDAGRLSVMLNGEILFSGKPECGVEIRQDMALSKLRGDENVLSWSVDSGRYIIDDVQIIIEREAVDSRNTFQISNELFSRIVAEGQQVYLGLTFRNQGAEGEISINGEELAFRTHKQSFAGPITSYVNPGSNTITVKASSSDILLLEVFYE